MPNISLVSGNNEEITYYTDNCLENPGCIIPFSSDTVPTGFLVCDGSSLSTTTYSRLFAEIGYIWGGSGASFNLPNLSDRFFRGKDSGAGRDSGGDRNIGSFQNSLVKRPSAMAVDNIGHSHFSNNNYWAGSGNSTVTTRNLLGTTVTSGGATLNDHTNITSTDTVLLPNCRPVKFIIKF